MFICDVSFGYLMEYARAHASGLGVAKRQYISMDSKEDVLMFGSSRMAHHYVSSIIEDSLGLSCYNCGEDGQGIIYTYGMLQLVLERYTPKAIIYDISDYDVVKDDKTKYITLLKPYSSNNKVKDIIVSVSPSDSLKLYSNMYKYNSTCISILGAMVSKTSFDKGYEPEFAVMDYEPDEVATQVKALDEIDPLKKKYIIAFIDDCADRGIKLIFSVSPMYHGNELTRKYSNVEKICQEHNIPFVYSLGEFDIVEDKKLFKDVLHLNNSGAIDFTELFVSKIKPFLK